MPRPVITGDSSPKPTTADFETVLLAMFATAEAGGESFLDVTSNALSKTVNGPSASARGASLCCRLMRRMMIPGDNELSDARSGYGSSLRIRYRLPR